MVPTDGTLTRIFDKSKIDVAKTKVSTTEMSKIEVLIVDEHTTIEDVEIIVEDYNLVVEGSYSLVDEVVATSAIDTLSSKCDKSD